MRRLASIAAALLAPTLLLSPAMADAPDGYDNPVTEGYSVDFPDPAVIKAKDGYWYAYSTGGPYDKAGQTGDSYKIARSKDLTNWEKVGSVFHSGNRPTWADPTSGFWAPDIRYLGGRYVLYFSVHNTTLTPQNWDYAIGVATAPTPAGPWTDSGAPVIAPRPAAGGGYQWTIDPAEFTDTDGRRYLYWGSYNGGLHAVRLTPDGLRATGPVTQVGSDRFEGPYVVKRGGWYYLFGSSSNCCAGPTTGYAVFAGRSRSPLGPFTDKLSASLLASRTGGTPVAYSNGNRWVGTGHSSIATDLSGQQWLAYHGVDRTDPFVTNSNGWLLRPMLLDRLDWIDGWPVINAGAGPAEHPAQRPVTTGLVHDGFDGDAGTFRTVTGELSVADGRAALSGALAVANRPVPADTRVEADVRTAGTVGLITRHRSPGTYVRAVVDTTRHQLRVEALDRGRVEWTRSAPLPASYDGVRWASLMLQTRGKVVTAELSDARLGEPYAVVEGNLPAAAWGAGTGVYGDGEVDNFSAAPVHRPVTRPAPTPRIGQADPAYSDEFADGLGAGWTWRNQSPDASVADGRLTWPTERNDLTNDTAPQASLLLRDQPSGSYVVETKLGLDVGTDTVRNYQQAGLLVYVDDENWLRLDHVAGGTGRFVEFGKRMRFQPAGAPSVVTFGGAMIGPPAATTWLRLAHDLVPGTGEHRYRAASSTDGRNWTWGAAWTLPADSDPEIGLVSQGSSAEAEAAHGKATAQFDYFRVLR